MPATIPVITAAYPGLLVGAKFQPQCMFSKTLSISTREPGNGLFFNAHSELR
jgi:hypothetical protein